MVLSGMKFDADEWMVLMRNKSRSTEFQSFSERKYEETENLKN